MRHGRNNTGEGPSPEEWTAYLDGELTPEQRERFEAFLAERPEAAAEADGCRRLLPLWQSAAPWLSDAVSLFRAPSKMPNVWWSRARSMRRSRT